MSTLYVDTINEKTTGNGIYIPGHVIQVVNTEHTARQSFNTATFAEITALSTAITPASSSSKILIHCNVTLSAFGHADLRIYRDIGGTETLLSVGDAAGSRTQSSFHTYSSTTYATTYDAKQSAILIQDTPATTSEVTYRTYIATPYSASYYVVVNGQYSEADAGYTGRTISTVTLMEIGG